MLNNRVVKFTIRFHHPGKTKREEERDCGGGDWNLTWREFMTKYYSFNLQNYHEIKSTISSGATFKPSDKVKEFINVFSRNVSKCIVRIVSKELDKTTPKGSGSNAVAKMAKNLQVPPKKMPLATQMKAKAPAASPPAKKRLPPAPPAPRISDVNSTTTTTTITRQTNKNNLNKDTTTANGNVRERSLSNSTQRVSRDNSPGTSGYLQSNLFNPNLKLPAIDVNARLYKRKYPEDDIKFPNQGPVMNIDDLDTASQLGRQINGFDFDDSSSVCSQDSQDSQDDGSLPNIRTTILNRWAKCSNSDFHKMLKEYRGYDSERKLKWMRRNPITNCCLGMVYDGLVPK